VADDPERSRGSWRKDIAIDGECLFERLAHREIGKLLAGIEHPRSADQMALLADTVARHGVKMGGIDDVPGAGVRKVRSGRYHRGIDRIRSVDE